MADRDPQTTKVSLMLLSKSWRLVLRPLDVEWNADGGLNQEFGSASNQEQRRIGVDYFHRRLSRVRSAGRMTRSILRQFDGSVALPTFEAVLRLSRVGQGRTSRAKVAVAEFFANALLDLLDLARSDLHMRAAAREGDLDRLNKLIHIAWAKGSARLLSRGALVYLHALMCGGTQLHK